MDVTPQIDVVKEQRWYTSEPAQYFISIATGIIAGITLNVVGVSDKLVTIVTLPGNLFLRALQCAVIPVSVLVSFKIYVMCIMQMIFFNIASSVSSIMGNGGSGSLGGRAILLYSISTILAVTQGILAASAFSFLFQSDLGDGDDDDGVKVSYVCPKDFGMMTATEDGQLLCIHHDQLDSYNLTSG
jgi:Na+/H+-dicarboxylate symporter